MSDVGKTPERVAQNSLSRLGIKFIDSDSLVIEMKKKVAMGQAPDRIADEVVEDLLPRRVSRDEARGQLEALAWLIRDNLTGGRT